MRTASTILPWVALAVVASGPGSPTLAQSVLYEVRPPSRFLGMEELSAPQPLSGSLVVTPAESGPSGTTYKLSEVDLRDRHGYHHTGSGTFQLGREDPPSEEVFLELYFGTSTTPEYYSGKGVASGHTRWPIIGIAADSPPGSCCPIVVLTLIAVPATEYVEYQLGPGSRFVVESEYSSLPLGARALAGTFYLGKISGDGPGSLYRLERAALRTLGGDEDWRFEGEGLFAPADANSTQRMDLYLRGSGMKPWGLELLLQDDDGQRGADLPRIDASVLYRGGPPPPRVIYTLRLAAAPATAAPYRRGDSNGDGQTDFSDALAILAWLYFGGPRPDCLEAADANGDSRHDLADGVSLLSFLFLGGEAPPFPGPRACGLPQEPALACEGYSACG